MKEHWVVRIALSDQEDAESSESVSVKEDVGCSEGR